MISNPSFPLHVYFFCLLPQFLKKHSKEGAHHYITPVIIVSRAHTADEFNGLSDAHMNAVTQRQFLRAQDVSLDSQ